MKGCELQALYVYRYNIYVRGLKYGSAFAAKMETKSSKLSLKVYIIVIYIYTVSLTYNRLI